VDDLEYDALSYLEAGHSVFRPVDASTEAVRAFAETVGLLLRLRRQGYVGFPDSRISKTDQGTYLAVGPVDLTPAGLVALLRDRRLGERPPRGYARPWRQEDG
jgi:hypothetical protein